MSQFDRPGIALRIRGLLSGQDGGDTSAAAARLGVDATSLHMSIDDDAPYPTVDVIAAIVRTYGVDPCWLLTGSYNTLTHRRSLDTTTDEMPILVANMLGGVTTDHQQH